MRSFTLRACLSERRAALVKRSLTAALAPCTDFAPEATLRPRRVAVALRRPAPGIRTRTMRPLASARRSLASADFTARPPAAAPLRREAGTPAGPQSGLLPPGMSSAALGEAPVVVQPLAKLGTLTTLMPSASAQA